MKAELAIAIVLAATNGAKADTMTDALERFLETELIAWVDDARLVDAVSAQNDVTLAYDQARIDELDQMWRAEIGQSDAPTITPVLENPLSAYLRDTVSRSEGRILEVFVMDARGLNVAASAPTSDYWQGDEEKFTETFGRGAGSTHIAEVEFDESTQGYQGQISLTIVDPDTGNAIGAVTLGIDPDAL